MAHKLERIIWSILCGATLGLAGCDEKDEPVAYGPPLDTMTDPEQDADDDAVDAQDDTLADPSEEDPGATYYGPVPDF